MRLRVRLGDVGEGENKGEAEAEAEGSIPLRTPRGRPVRCTRSDSLL